MESPLEVLSRVAFMVNKSLPQQGDYASLHKYGAELGRLSCWRGKDFAELQRLERRRKKSASSAVCADGRFSEQDRTVMADEATKEESKQRDSIESHRSNEPQPCRRSSAEAAGSAAQWTEPSGRVLHDALRVSQPAYGGSCDSREPRPLDPASHDADRSDAEQQTPDGDAEPLNLSMRRRSYSPERKPSAGASVVTSAADPAVEEHFRRSLGQSYEGAHARRGPDGECSQIAASIEEHFFKSLGSTAWLKPDSPKARHTATSAPPKSRVAPAPPPPHPGPPAALPRGSRQPPALGSVAVRSRPSPAAQRKRSRQPMRDISSRGECAAPAPASSDFPVVRGCRGGANGHLAPPQPAAAATCRPGDPAAKKPRPCDESPSPSHQQLQQGVRGGAAASAAEAALAAVAAAAGRVSPAAANAEAAATAAGESAEAAVRDGQGAPLQQWSEPSPAAAAADDNADDGREPSAVQYWTASFASCPGGGVASVDEHFAKALGNKWAEIKRHLSALPQPPTAVKEEP